MDKSLLFTNDPFEFAKNNPILVTFDTHGNRGNATTNAVKMKNDPLSNDSKDALFQVRSAKKVYPMQILWDGNLGSNKVKASTALTGDGFYSYYLPWMKDTIVRMTLRPSKTLVNVTEKEDPDYFFTAAVNGCTVIVEGDPLTPTVYHANAMEEGGNDNSPTVHFNSNNLVLGQQVLDRKQNIMLNKFQNHRTNFQKADPNLETSVIKASEYMTYQNTQEFNNYLADLTRGIPKSKLAWKKKDEIEILESQGCVFGLKSDIDYKWSFYYQRLVKTKRYKFSLNYPHQWKSQGKYKKTELSSDWRVVECKKFYPNDGNNPSYRL